MNKINTFAIITLAMALSSLYSCQNDPVEPPLPEGIEEETYAGGQLGTTFQPICLCLRRPHPCRGIQRHDQRF